MEGNIKKYGIIALLIANFAFSFYLSSEIAETNVKVSNITKAIGKADAKSSGGGAF